MKRRTFLKASLLAAGGLSGFAAQNAYSLAADAASKALTPYNPLRVLGRTGLKVPAVGFGAMVCGDSEIILYALDRGVLMIDTADCYMGGQNERIVGEAVKGRRDKLVIATKVHLGDRESMIKSVDKSLTSLKTDYVDIMQVHGVSTEREIKHEVAKQVFQDLKKAGKIRFAGVTTHSGQVEVLKAVREDGFYDTVLVAANFRSPQPLFDEIAKAADAGVGIIGMKTQNGGYPGNPYNATPFAAALRFVLEKPGFHTAVPGMHSLKMVDENLGAFGMGGPIKSGLLEEYKERLATRACSYCNACVGECLYGQGGMAAVRAATYLDGYLNPWLASERAKGDLAAISRCAGCAECTANCRQNIDIPKRARMAMGVFREA